METKNLNTTPNRRGFLKVLGSSAALLGLSTIASPVRGAVKDVAGIDGKSEAEAWFKNIKGKHRIVFDVTRPHNVLPFAWPRVFLMTNVATGTPEKENSVVVVLRHDAVGYAFEDRLWAKYNFGELFKADDPHTNKPSTGNSFWKPEKGAFKIPGVGEVQIGINELQESGVLFCVCNAAITVNSARAAEKMNMDAAEVKKDWESGLLPGIQVVPSGVWAVGRAQENGCAYCFAG